MIDVEKVTRKREVLPANDVELGIHHRRDETIVGKKVEIGAGRVCDEFYSCTFQDCEIRLCASGRLIRVATSGQFFRDCYIWAAQKQVIPIWEASFERCYFRGVYEARFAGPVVDCDFTAATLNAAAFLQAVSLGAVVWPKWPHIVIDSPKLHYQDWAQIPKPAEFNPHLVPKEGIAAVVNLRDAVEDPEALWEFMRQKEYIHTDRVD